MTAPAFSQFLSAFVAAVILSSCVSTPPGEGTAGQASETGATPDLSWHATHDWVTRQWAESTVHLSVNGASHAVGAHASKEEELVELRRSDFPNFIPADAVSAIQSYSSSGKVYYYAVPKGADQLSVFQYHLNDMALDDTPSREKLTTIRY